MTMGINTELAIRKEDMQTVMDTLVYDNMIELVDEKMGKYRKTPTPTPDMNPFSEIPCSYCPVFHECHDKGGEFFKILLVTYILRYHTFKLCVL